MDYFWDHSSVQKKVDLIAMPLETFWLIFYQQLVPVWSRHVLFHIDLILPLIPSIFDRKMSHLVLGMRAMVFRNRRYRSVLSGSHGWRCRNTSRFLGCDGLNNDSLSNSLCFNFIMIIPRYMINK